MNLNKTDVWAEAARDLNLNIEAPFSVCLENGELLNAAFVVREFGDKNGMLVFRDSSQVSNYGNRITDLGFSYSIIREPKNKVNYCKETFVNILSDWGWTGPHEEEPDWLIE